jgi:alpha-tubulin suppressor-like RCC1 family protein
MTKPTQFLKFGRRGDPHWRKFSLVWLDQNRGAAIRWETKKKTKTPEIKIQLMKEVRFGQNSAVFKRKTMPHLNSLSFTILYNTPSGKEETLDLIAKHPDDFFIWTVGIKHAIINGIGASNVEASAWERAEEEADLELMAEMDDYEIFDEHDDGGADDDHEEEDDRLITTGNVMFSWGFNGWGQLGLVEQYAGDQHVMVPANTTGYTCKRVDHGEENESKTHDMSFDIQTIACGGNFTVAVDSRMKCYIWGHGSVCGGVADKFGGSVRRNDHVLQPSPLREPFKNIPIALAAAGEQHVLFLSQAGDIYSCGVNDCGQLGVGHLNDVGQPVKVEMGGMTSKGVSAGHSISAAVTSDGKIYTWGCGMFGALGRGDEENKTSPGLVKMLSADSEMEVKTVSCGQYHMAAILIKTSDPTMKSGSVTAKDTTKVVTWGWNGCGQLGLGDFDNRNTPQCVEVLSGGGKVVEQIVCGAAHCAAVVNLSMGELEIQGQLWTWGNGAAALANADAAHSETPRPFYLTKKGHESIEVFRIAAGDNFTLVLDDEGGLMVVGVHPIMSNGRSVQDGLDIDKVGINGVDGLVTEIAAGGRHIAVLAPKRFAYSSLLA